MRNANRQSPRQKEPGRRSAAGRVAGALERAGNFAFRSKARWVILGVLASLVVWWGGFFSGGETPGPEERSSRLAGGMADSVSFNEPGGEEEEFSGGASGGSSEAASSPTTNIAPPADMGKEVFWVQQIVDDETLELISQQGSDYNPTIRVSLAGVETPSPSERNRPLWTEDVGLSPPQVPFFSKVTSRVLAGIAEHKMVLVEHVSGETTPEDGGPAYVWLANKKGVPRVMLNEVLADRGFAVYAPGEGGDRYAEGLSKSTSEALSKPAGVFAAAAKNKSGGSGSAATGRASAAGAAGGIEEEAARADSVSQSPPDTTSGAEEDRDMGFPVGGQSR